MTIDPVSSAQVLFDGMLTTPQLDHPESVAVARDGSIWCGGEAGQIFRISDGQIDLVASTHGFNLGVGFLDEATLAVCDIAARTVWLLDIPSRTLSELSRSAPGHELVTPNAVTPLPDGSMLVTDSGIAHTPRTGVLRYRRNGHCEVWLDDALDFANGIALSPDNRTVYIAESWACRILAVSVDPVDWTPSSYRVYAELGRTLPDGLCVGPDGTLYVGCYEPSQVLRIPERGVVEVLASDPTAHTLCHPTGVAFRESELVVANLGRWHLSSIPLVP